MLNTDKQLVGYLGKQTRVDKRTMLEDMPPEPMTDIDTFATSPTMRGMLDQMMEKVNSVNLRNTVILLAGYLMYMNAQWPGTVANATIKKYRSATITTQRRESYKTFYVSQHITQTTGRAKLSAPTNLYKSIDKYVDWVRPILEGSCNSRLLVPNRDGQPLDHLSRHVKFLSTKLGFTTPSTANATRHSVATAVVSKGQEDQAALQMQYISLRADTEIMPLLKGKKRLCRVSNSCRARKMGNREG